MMCIEVVRSIPLLLDDELDLANAQEVEAHIQQCASCRAVLEHEGRLRLALLQVSQQVTASASLRRKVNALIVNERPQSRWVHAWPAVAAASLLIVLIWKGQTTNHVSDLDVIAKGPDLPMDVVAADVAPLQAYFSSKLPFAVHLPHISDGAVNSFGGRVMNLRNRYAAFVRYNMQRGHVSMLVYEDNDEDFPETAPLYRIGNERMLVKQVRGYTVAKWRSSGLTYSVVTDLPVEEFSTLVRARR
ncbi:MAG: zf-HC2 domain-containing protein [Deltaproteobacteria bacterium]|nr:zf-HC2 domain-containing protein [Deltaproteobacteria bacterium]